MLRLPAHGARDVRRVRREGAAGIAMCHVRVKVVAGVAPSYAAVFLVVVGVGHVLLLELVVERVDRGRLLVVGDGQVRVDGCVGARVAACPRR